MSTKPGRKRVIPPFERDWRMERALIEMGMRETMEERFVFLPMEKRMRRVVDILRPTLWVMDCRIKSPYEQGNYWVKRKISKRMFQRALAIHRRKHGL